MANQKTGEYAFLVGVVIAVLGAIAWQTKALDAAAAGWVSALLVVLGIVVGVLNIKDKEFQPFLVAAIALLVAGTTRFDALNIATLANVGGYLNSIVGNLAVLVAPAAVIAAIKATWSLASGK